jgi:hypothetical protein
MCGFGRKQTFGGADLQGQTKERWKQLCEQAVVEQSPDKFLSIIEELDQLLTQLEAKKPVIANRAEELPQSDWPST